MGFNLEQVTLEARNVPQRRNASWYELHETKSTPRKHTIITFWHIMTTNWTLRMNSSSWRRRITDQPSVVFLTLLRCSTAWFQILWMIWTKVKIRFVNVQKDYSKKSRQHHSVVSASRSHTNPSFCDDNRVIRSSPRQQRYRSHRGAETEPPEASSHKERVILIHADPDVNSEAYLR